MQTYLKRFYLDDWKLAQRALLECSRALTNRRMVAFTGAMSTEALGYGSWTDLARDYMRVAQALSLHIPPGSAVTDPIRSAQTAIDHMANRISDIDVRSAFSVAREGLQAIDDLPLESAVGRIEAHGDGFKVLTSEGLPLAGRFGPVGPDGADAPPSRASGADLRPVASGRVRMLDLWLSERFGTPAATASASSAEVASTLILDALSIRRVATLNYDMELEYVTMTTPEERGDAETDAQKKPFLRSPLHLIRKLQSQSQFIKDPSISTRLTRVMTSGQKIESDILDRERLDRLIEFAVGGVSADRHIMHLHGRACTPDKLIVSLRDYDLLYRKNDIRRLPFDQAFRILFAGNPVIFVGVGMTEEEINRTLQMYVSNNPYRFTPTFLLWNTSSFPQNPLELKREKAVRRADYLQRLGVFTIFDDDLPHTQALKIQRAARAARGGEKDDAERTLAKIEVELADARAAAKANATPRSAPGVDGIDEDDAGQEIAGIHTGPADANAGAATASTRGIVELEAAKSEAKRAKKAIDDELRVMDLRLLSASLVALGRATRGINARTHEQFREFRTLNDRIKPGPNGIRTIFNPILDPDRRRDPKLDPNNCLLEKIGSDSPVLRVVIGPPGCGKGTVARSLAERISGVAKDRRLLINAGFAFDTDSLLTAIALFLNELRAVGTPPRHSREWQFNDRTAFEGRDGPALIVMNGVERFFSVTGLPLSAELDHLFRCIAERAPSQNGVRWILFGTDRVRRYFQTIAPTSLVRFETVEPPHRPDDSVAPRHEYLWAVSDYFRRKGEKPDPDPAAHRLNAIRDTLESSRPDDVRDLERLRRSVFEIVLDPGFLAGRKIGKPGAIELWLEILRAMAFIGSPVEAVVLFHVPRVRAKLGRLVEQIDPPPAEKTDAQFDLLAAALTRLQDLRLLLPMECFDASIPGRRFALHRTVTAELRRRFGVPLSESKLSTAFNMSLYAAQPVDGYVPEPDIHDELGNLIDSLIGAWKDPEAKIEKMRMISAHDAEIRRAANACIPKLPKRGERQKIPSIVAPAQIAALRAALSVIRGYYSTTSLLTLDRGDRLVGDERDGVLLEHAERLERLLRAYRKTARYRDAAREVLDRTAKTRSPPPEGRAPEPTSDKPHAPLGPEPFYPDEVVWLYNELGVVYLAQGNLHAANRALNDALVVNSEHVEYGDRSHNWRRITINRVRLLIERGELDAADRLVREIEHAVDVRPAFSGVPRPDPAAQEQPGTDEDAGSADGTHSDLCHPAEDELSRSARIRRHFGASASSWNVSLQTDMTQEEVLSIGLTLGYRGLIEHLRGHHLTASQYYVDAIATLRRLDEQRAYAYFQRHYAQLGRFTDGSTREREIEYAIAAAESVRQMDLAYHSRMAMAELRRNSDSARPQERRHALQTLNDALAYAALTDNYRLRIEAGMCLARVKLASGDFETALDHASDAMAVASRFGHRLRKIGLRVLIGQILIRRGDPRSGTALLESAVEIADRYGYQRAVALAQRARAEEATAARATERAPDQII